MPKVEKQAATLPDTLVTAAMVIENDRDIVSDAIREVSDILSQDYRYYEILVVDNGSTDGSAQVVKELQKKLPKIRLLILSRSYHPEIAFSAALDNAIGDFVVLLDPNCDPPNLISTLVRKALEGHDIVVAERKDRKDDSFIERISAHVFYWISSKTLGFEFSPNASYFRVLSRRAVNSIVQIKSKNRYLKYFNAIVGFKQISHPYERRYRRPPRRGLRNFLERISFGLKVIVSNSNVPLRIATLIGVVASFLSLVFIGYVFVVALIKKDVVEGWISTSLVNAAMFFLIFSILTIISEYIAQILDETKDQPLYFIAEEHTTADLPSEEINRPNVV